MKAPKIGRFGVALIAFCLGAGSCFLVSRFLRKLVEGFEAPVEETRVTSPSGSLDAVMTRQGYGGGAGGFEWCVFIVLKGKAAPSECERAIFQAGELSGEKLVWKPAPPS
jgi:hypothetical protein